MSFSAIAQNKKRKTMNIKLLRLTIILILFSMAALVAQNLTYAEELLPDQPYPYKDYPPSPERVRLFSLIHNYLLKDDPMTMMPSSNIIDLSDKVVELWI